MSKALVTLTMLALFSASAYAQFPVRRPSVRASGQGSVSVKPDQVKVDVSVITQAATAQDASDQNAGQTAAVLAALNALLGANADIKTIGYSITPNYRYPPGGGTATLTGYTATNSIEVTLGTLSMAGRVIDTATQAGANSIQGLQFSLKDPEPARQQALRLATMQAKAHADAMAGGLGAKVGAVISVQEGAATSVTPVLAGAGAAATPIQPGMIEVTATVTLEAELVS